MKIEKFYPGFTKKAITFTIDDGNVVLDRKFIDIVKPAGIFGTFNLSTVNLDKFSKEEYRNLYSGFGIANHCKFHPFAFEPGIEYKISEEPFDKDTANPELIYKTQVSGMYLQMRTRGWLRIADKTGYLNLVDDGKSDLEEVFGKGSIKSYVWPYFEQKDSTILDEIVKKGYRSIRKTGEVKDSTGYALPEDRMRWSYNANHASLLEEAEKYDKYEITDGELKYFAFGVHSHDFENNDCWWILEEFAQKYGNRREDFYYASVDDIFDYEDAIKALVVEEGKVVNNSNLPIYLKMDEEYLIIEANSSISR